MPIVAVGMPLREQLIYIKKVLEVGCYMLINKNTDIVQSVFSWQNNEIDVDYPIPEDQYLLQLDDDVFFTAQERFMQIGSLRVKDQTAKTYNDIFEEMPEISERSNRIAELKQYLADTDFYYVRMLETGEEVPSDVVTNRIGARLTLREYGL
jgi:hypothetical protein